MTLRLLPACGVALVALVVAAPSYAQDDIFRAGLEARNNMRWPDVVRQMRLAIAANPQESPRKVREGGFLGVGGRETEYLPHYFLAEALFRLGDCATAVPEWSVSEQQGAVRVRADLLKELQSGYVACEAKGVLPPGKYDPLVADTRRQITDVNGLALNASNLGTANPDLFGGDAREQYNRAYGDIQSARTQLETAERTRSARDFQTASASAERARVTLNTLTRALNSVIETRRSIQAQAGEVDQLITQADGDDREIDRRKALLTPALSAIRQSARQGLTGARESLAAGRAASNAPMLTEARTRVVDASSKFTQVLDELTRRERTQARERVSVAQASAQEALAFVDSAFSTLNDRMAKQPELVVPETTTQVSDVQRDLTAVQRRVDAASAGQNVAALEAATRQALTLRDRLNALITAFGPLPVALQVHPVLFEGARLFFQGDYRTMLAALEPLEASTSGDPLQLHVHLFRAAALFNLFVSSRETDAALRTQAVQEVVRCKELDPGFQPDPRAFGPRFLAFFQSVAASDAAATQPATN